MDKNAIINQKNVILNKDEISNAAKFHKERVAFAFINKTCVFNEDSNDDRDHQHWLCEDYGLSIKDFEKCIRGYMKPGKIFIYQSSHFTKVDLNNLTAMDIITLIVQYRKHYQTEQIELYNGVQIGKVGEEWNGIEKIMTVRL